MTTDTPIKIQIVKSLSNLKPSRMIAVKADNESSFSLYVTDKNGVPYPLKDISGSGIGLSICKSVVKLHNGNIKAISRNNGISIEINLPVMKRAKILWKN